jgi:DNA-binding response OmpR family regulator
MDKFAPLSQRSILLVEDEPLLAMDMELLLSNAGFGLLGPVVSVGDAMGLIRDKAPDLTILDLNLGGEMVFPLLDCLSERAIPFVVLSGHSREMVPARHRDRPFLQKPCDPAALLATVRKVLNANGIAGDRNGQRHGSAG